MKTKNVTIEQLEAFPIRGNFDQDSDLLDACHDFIVNEKNPMADRIRALKVVDQVMGVESEDEIDETAVLEFVSEMA